MTSQQIKSLLTLIIVFMLVLFMFLVIHHIAEESAAASEGSVSPIISFDAGSLANISFLRADEHYSFSSFNGFWILDSSPELSISQDFMNSLALILSSVTPILSINSPADLSAYGLDEPSATVQLTLFDGETIKFYIGDRNSRTLDYYIRLDDTPSMVYLVDYSIGKSFEYSLEEIS